MGRIGKRLFRCGTDFPASCRSFINISLLTACCPLHPSVPRWGWEALAGPGSYPAPPLPRAEEDGTEHSCLSTVKVALSSGLRLTVGKGLPWNLECLPLGSLEVVQGAFEHAAPFCLQLSPPPPRSPRQTLREAAGQRSLISPASDKLLIKRALPPTRLQLSPPPFPGELNKGGWRPASAHQLVRVLSGRGPEEPRWVWKRRWPARNPLPLRLIYIAEPASEDSTVPQSTAYSSSGLEKGSRRGNFFVASVSPLFKENFFSFKNSALPLQTSLHRAKFRL